KNLFAELKNYFGQKVVVIGIAHFKPGGQLSHIKMEHFSQVDERLKIFSKKPHKMNLQQQIALQLLEGKKSNPLSEIIGQWPGDESIEELLSMLKEVRK
ncbi:MAG: hypothetical protein NZ521_03270, partial [Flammeovirgaceae bacterium]|nr:hypothetical protein [Flammeovirgaceae bacterium]MDW8288268.1 hypothetical protein [Flammeovirgaceae bacterium]